MRTKNFLKDGLSNNKGITLMSLIVTIIVLIIVAAIAVPEGSKAIENAKATTATAEMQAIQEKVDELYQKLKNGDETVLGIGVDLEKHNYNTLNEGIREKIATAFGEAISMSVEDASNEGFRYYTENTLESLGLQGFSQEFLVNVKSKEVISLQGVVYQGYKYYMITQLPNGLYSVEYDDTVYSETKFDLDYSDKNGALALELRNIKYSGNVKKGTIYYGQGETDDSVDWKVAASNIADDSYKINIADEGIWYVKIIDAAGNTSDIKRIEVEHDI